MDRILAFIKAQIEKVRDFFIKKKSRANNQNPKIVIGQINDRTPSAPIIPPAVQQSEPQDAPQITIHGVNQRTPIASGTNIYQSDVEVQNPNLGGGITVNRQRKPRRCPLCAIHRGIIENPDGNPRWKCADPDGCGGTFN